MTFAELISQVATNAGVTQRQSRTVITELVLVIRSNMERGVETTLPSLGTFTVGRTPARIGMNPKTRDPIHVKAKKVPKLKIATALKNAVN